MLCLNLLQKQLEKSWNDKNPGEKPGNCWLSGGTYRLAASTKDQGHNWTNLFPVFPFSWISKARYLLEKLYILDSKWDDCALSIKFKINETINMISSLSMIS